MADYSSCKSCRRQGSLNDTAQKYVGCAPLMSDGRLFTNWKPRCAQVYNQDFSLSCHEARHKLISHASEIMKDNAGQAYIASKCGPCYENPDWNTGTMLPELNTQVCNARTCTFAPNNKSGLGLGRQYWNPQMDSDYQKRFLSEKEKEQSFLNNSLKT